MQIPLLLSLATNLFGDLSDDAKATLEAVVHHPCEATWEEAHCLILDRHSWMTLWQAVIAVDQRMQFGKPIDGPWPMIPDSDTLVRAIGYAVR